MNSFQQAFCHGQQHLLVHPLLTFPEGQLVFSTPRVTPKSLPTVRARVKANAAERTEERRELSLVFSEGPLTLKGGLRRGSWLYDSPIYNIVLLVFRMDF